MAACGARRPSPDAEPTATGGAIAAPNLPGVAASGGVAVSPGPTAGSASGGTAAGGFAAGGQPPDAATGGASNSGASELHHPGLLTDLAKLEGIKRLIEGGAEPWASELVALGAAAQTAELHRPPSDRKIFCGGYNRDENGVKILECDYAVENGIAAYSLALLGYFTANREHSEEAIRFVMAWADDFQGFDPEPRPGATGNNALLQAGWTAPWFANAAEILRYTYAGWTADHTTRASGLLKRLLPQVEDDTVGASNNWLHSRIEAHIAIAIFLDDRAMLDTALSQWRENTPSYFYIAADGERPPPPSRGMTAQALDAIWDTPSYVPGMTMETCRDLNHQQLGVRSIFNSLAMASTQGIDVLADTDIHERLSTFLEEQAKWMVAKRDPTGACHEPIVVSPGEPPKYMDQARPVPYEIGFGLLRSASEPLATAHAAIAASPATRAARWVQKWETLTHHSDQ